MKIFFKPLLTILFLIGAFTASAQTAADLVTQGITLHDAGKFTDAIDKYDQAITLDPNFAKAYYEKGYTLFISGKPKDAIPVLEKLLQVNPKAGGGYDILGTIYDDDKQADKAMEYYKRGIEADPEYQRLHFNLAIAYYRQNKFPEAEACAIDAIKLDPQHASSIRVYAMSTYKQQKRGSSLLAWCSFLLLEPQTDRSAVAYKYVNNILNYGITRTDEKNIKMSVSPTDMSTGSMTMQLAVVAATTGKKGLGSVDSLSLQLSSVFSISYSIIGDKASAYSKHLAKYFNDFGKTGNVPAIAHLISQTAYKDEDQAWLKEHQKELDDLNKWVKDADLSF